MMNRNETTTLLAIVGIALVDSNDNAITNTSIRSLGSRLYSLYRIRKSRLDASGPAFNINGEEKDNNEDSTTATTDEDERQVLMMSLNQKTKTLLGQTMKNYRLVFLVLRAKDLPQRRKQ